MSSIKLTADSGGGTFEIKAPSSSGNTRVLTLPDTGNLTLHGGRILQVVQVTHTAEVSTTGITYVDTGLSASITPSSSSNKILVMVTQRFFIERSTDQARGGFRLLRGSSVIMQGPNTNTGQEPGGEGQSTNLGGSTQVAGAFNCTFLDSPSTTSSTTYKRQFANNQSSASPTIFVNSLNNNSGDDGVSTMTLMEVAA